MRILTDATSETKKNERKRITHEDFHITAFSSHLFRRKGSRLKSHSGLNSAMNILKSNKVTIKIDWGQKDHGY